MCDIKHCRNTDVHVTYYKHEVCHKCWVSYCQDRIDLKKEFNIKCK